ncbi:GNAT family N-acetyltransferase [Paludibacterium yongneupense]|uniref:GNAT family N-acetyltransferase n=1 Tax=Paludibacterium yongneupense TaxID=400061 RepID=UPI000683FA6C|nr:GNAT family N-acetyltransferase [Paludibacterium yongneupense]
MPLIIRPMQADDWGAVARIYLAGIAGGNATFQTEVPEWVQWDAAHLASCRLVAQKEEKVLAWAALSAISSREVYRGVAELSIYVDPAVAGTGIGTALLMRLIDESERQGIWTLQAGIFPENAASLALHRRQGFRQVGRREKLAQLHGIWRDVLLVERRSRQPAAAAARHPTAAAR